MLHVENWMDRPEKNMKISECKCQISLDWTHLLKSETVEWVTSHTKEPAANKMPNNDDARLLGWD